MFAIHEKSSERRKYRLKGKSVRRGRVGGYWTEGQLKGTGRKRERDCEGQEGGAHGKSSAMASCRRRPPQKAAVTKEQVSETLRVWRACVWFVCAGRIGVLLGWVQ